ncbi:DUF1127 domain-containing protein [Palleronia rufa]|uniref:DUF1127 domain-containing protein n=1 Tax=Palleronia rufa TaxID=1530186 RepID=UPI00068E7382|nr:DUF1127 domain-containing protein [Palleronia rufa]
MATNRIVAAPSAPRFDQGFDHIATSWRRWRVANRTRSALAALSDRELADLGIERHDIPRIAREAARNGQA